MATDRGYFKFYYILIIVSFLSCSILSSFIQFSFAQKTDNEEKEKIIVEDDINLKNIDMDNTTFIRLIGFINGEVKQHTPISSIDKTKGKLKVDLKVNEENDIVEADSPDEFFVCAYQVGDLSKESNNITKFDCNEGDILGNPTQISLYKSGSHVYEKSQAVYGANVNKTGFGSNNDKVKIKIYAPLSDKKGTDKLVIAAMIKGQIQSQVINDVQAELDKRDNNKIQKSLHLTEIRILAESK
ncbi:MAG TPA: hypothetical protein VFK40_15175 [Nitrososphaeraceae archaeon]|nr:hypothetical protein [Nitrososphaeraceae archaeon]